MLAAGVNPTEGAQPPQDSTSRSSNDSAHLSAQIDQRQKRDYLNLLPTAQIIEICLSLDSQVPSHVRHTIWPINIEVAIQILKESTAKNTTFPKTGHPPNSDPSTNPVSQDAQAPPQTSPTKENSLPSSSSPGHTPSTPTASSSSSVAQPPFQNLLQAPAVSSSQGQSSPNVQNVPSNASSNAGAGTSHPSPHPSANNGTSQSHPPHPHSSSHPPPPYSYAPYGYPGHPQQAAYPHSPYYPPPVPGYAPPYPGYPPYPPHGYPPPPHGQPYPPHPPLPPGHIPSNSTSANAQTSAEDLPSYEDMIVEALLDITDPEGAAPKDMFAWMSARYPLQTNFRPSASQALQKAFRRGRLEKRPGGKYRLNATWEGGATTRRTTRRPQTVAQAAYAAQTPAQPSSSPFTNAPLPNRSSNTSPPASQSKPLQQPYASYPYGYPGYSQYPGYPPNPQSQPIASNSTNSSSVTDPKPGESNKSIKENDPSTEGGDAWEAAQHILKAINFGSLQSQTTSEAPSSHAPPPPPTTALSGIDLLSSLGIVLPSDDEPARSALTEEERASLQAQLALLAAQLSEIADLEDDEGNATDEEDPRDHTVGAQSSTEATIETRPPAIPAPPVPVNDPMQDDEDDDEDDMEMVEVPTLPVETRT